MDIALLDAVAEQIADARKVAAPFPNLADDARPVSVGEGYAVQSAVHDALGTPMVGWKIGCTTPAMQDLLGVPHPAAGGMTSLLPSGSSLGRGLFQVPGLEGEVAFRIGTDVPLDDGYDIARITPYVEDCMAAIEVVDNRYGDFKSRTVGELIADDFFQSDCVLGEPVANWQSLDLSALAGRTFINDALVMEGTTAAVMGHPLNSLSWLANTLALQGRSLKAGDVVMSGAIAGVAWVPEGPAAAVVEIDGLGRVSVTIS